MVHLIAPDDVDPDDALDTQWLHDHDGAPALELPRPEQEARDWVLDSGHWMAVRDATDYFVLALDYTLDYIENGGGDETPY